MDDEINKSLHMGCLMSLRIENTMISIVCIETEGMLIASMKEFELIV